MYKPCNIREMVTPALHYKIVDGPIINGYTSKEKQLASKPNLRGKFKLKGTSEVTANGLIVVNDKTTFQTWYKADFESGDILNIGGIDYKIIGTPENVEMRGRYSVLNLERIEGGV